MNSIFKLLENPNLKELAYDVIDILVVERLQEHYIMCLDFDDFDTAKDILAVLRYFTTYEEFNAFLKETRYAGYTDQGKR